MFSAISTIKSFEHLFSSLSLHQQFNRKGSVFESDENESALRKYLRAMNGL